jgi:hypothetical protein
MSSTHVRHFCPRRRAASHLMKTRGVKPETPMLQQPLIRFSFLLTIRSERRMVVGFPRRHPHARSMRMHPLAREGWEKRSPLWHGVVVKAAGRATGPESAETDSAVIRGLSSTNTCLNSS